MASISQSLMPLPRGMIGLLDSQVVTTRQRGMQFLQQPKAEPAPPPIRLADTRSAENGNASQPATAAAPTVTANNNNRSGNSGGRGQHVDVRA